MILDAKDFSLRVLSRIGLGGRVMVAQNTDSCYYFKAESVAQSINEVVGQEYLRVLGYPSVPTVWIKYKGKTYGALEEIHGERVKHYGELFFMNLYLENSDAGEFFECTDGLTRCLDLGEAIMSTTFVQLLAQGVNVPIPPKKVSSVLSIAY